MQVIRTVRLHDQSSSERYVRVIGDGTPEHTRLLDYQGNPLPEIVTSFTIAMTNNGCARGTFKHIPIDPANHEPGAMRTFEAIVLFERLAPLEEVRRLRERVRSLEELPDRIVTLLRDGLDDVESIFRNEFGALMTPVPDYTEDSPSDGPEADETPADLEPEPGSVLAVPGPGVRELLSLRDPA